MTQCWDARRPQAWGKKMAQFQYLILKVKFSAFLRRSKTLGLILILSPKYWAKPCGESDIFFPRCWKWSNQSSFTWFPYKNYKTEHYRFQFYECSWGLLSNWHQLQQLLWEIESFLTLTMFSHLLLNFFSGNVSKNCAVCALAVPTCPCTCMLWYAMPWKEATKQWCPRILSVRGSVRAML